MSDVREEVAPAARESRRNAHGDFIWYELMTPDPEGAKAFYDAVVGWNIGAAAPEFNGYRMIETAGGSAGGVLPLTAEMQQHGARPTWLVYIGVDDVDRAVASIEQARGKALMPAFDIPNVGRIALVADPQGVPFYVMRGASEEASEVFSADKVGRCGWNELQTSDPEAARRFYGEQFGWTSEEFIPMGELGEYRFFDHHGARLGAVYHPANEGFEAKAGQSRWRPYFRVSSIATAKDAVEHHGGTVAMGPHQVPTGDWIIVGTDPQGAEFAFFGGQ